MTAATSKSMNQAWDAAVAQAETLTLPETLWERPKVEGFTIDGPTSRDLDDAIWLEKTDTGAIVSVHIADVAEVVRVGSAVDKVALARTQTNYYGWGNEPMIPHALSENLLSLWANRRRPTLTIQITLNEDAEIIETEIFESWLKSKKKLSYKDADAIAKDEDAPFHHMFKLYQTWAEKLARQRESMGAFGGLLSKSGVLFDEDGNVISQKKFFHSQIIIQEFMILANRAVAQWLADRDILALYRNHTAKAIAPERADLMNALLLTGNVHLIQQKLQNCLNKATYNPTLIGHYALNLSAYCHFTSPIRRLSDLINHRIVKAEINGRQHSYNRIELEQLCNHISDVVKDLEQKKENYHTARTKRYMSRQLFDPRALEALPEKEFTNVLKHSLRDENFTPIRETAIARLTQGKLTVQDLFLLLVQSGDREIQQLVLGDLKNHPEDATSIIALGLNQEPTWDDFHYLEEFQEGGFIFWAEVIVAGLPYTTIHPAIENKKQRSRQLACLAWLEAFVNGELVAPEQREIPKAPVVEKAIAEVRQVQPKPSKQDSILSLNITDGHNAIGLLQQLCQKSKWELPSYQVEEANDGFVCQCSVEIEGRSLTGEGKASKKKRAKWLAAKDVLEKLQEGSGR